MADEPSARQGLPSAARAGRAARDPFSAVGSSRDPVGSRYSEILEELRSGQARLAVLSAAVARATEEDRPAAARRLEEEARRMLAAVQVCLSLFETIPTDPAPGR
jgi:hypothetical protein